MKLNNYHVQHVDLLIAIEVGHEEDYDDTSEVDPRNTGEMNEWESLSHMGVAGGENFNTLEMLA